MWSSPFSKRQPILILHQGRSTKRWDGSHLGSSRATQMGGPSQTSTTKMKKTYQWPLLVFQLYPFTAWTMHLPSSLEAAVLIHITPTLFKFLLTGSPRSFCLCLHRNRNLRGPKRWGETWHSVSRSFPLQNILVPVMWRLAILKFHAFVFVKQ